MREYYHFKDDEKNSIIERFGPSFFNDVQWNIEQFARQWSLSRLQLLPSYSANIVFTCHSKRYGEVILKMAPPSSKEFKTELQALQNHQGRQFCNVYAVDIEHAVLLLERIMPGTSLREEPSLEKRLATFCSIYRDLHFLPRRVESYPFPTYVDWVNRITAYMSKQPQEELYLYMKKAQKLCTKIAKEFNQITLLHGDLHHDNILLRSNGQYVLIDPKGVLGDPVFDIARFMLNEFEEELTPSVANKMSSIIQYLENNLLLSQSILKKLLFVETTLGACWQVEDGASEVELKKTLSLVKFTASLLTDNSV